MKLKGASEVEKLEATFFDVTGSIFDNKTNESLYVIRDVYAAETVFVLHCKDIRFHWSSVKNIMSLIWSKVLNLIIFLIMMKKKNLKMKSEEL